MMAYTGMVRPWATLTVPYTLGCLAPERQIAENGRIGHEVSMMRHEARADTN